MKLKLILAFLVLFSFKMISQIAMANHFPTMKPHHILDEKKDSISFAFSMRLLESDYNGPIIKLRRDPGDGSTNDEKDFYCTDSDIVDITAINNWASEVTGSQTLHVVTWYDQSGLGRNAVQTDEDKQPVFTADASYPYFNSDDIEDILVVETSTSANLTNNGKNGTIISILYATNNNNHSFGVRDASTGSNRWLAHVNWSDNKLYFDPGGSSGSRSINNGANVNSWVQYSILRRDNPLNVNQDRRIFRINNTEIQNNNVNNNFQLTGDYYFGIGGTISNTITSANPYNTFQHSTTRFCEFIMYAAGKEDDFLSEIEQNQMAFWNL